MGCQYYEPTEGGANTFTVAMPRLTFGRGCLAEIGARAARLGMSRVGVLTDPHLKDTQIVTTVTDSLSRADKDFSVFSSIRIEPCDDTVAEATRFLADGKFDGIVSVGGGSVMDTAKAALACMAGNRPVLDFFAPPVGRGQPVQGPLPPHIACATTSGTGSECTSISVIRINELNTKFVFASPWMLPDEALVDPDCFDSLPGKVVASTGFDAICHALECFTSRAYTRHGKIDDPNRRQYIQGANPWSEISAIKAMALVSTYLARAVTDAGDSEAREQLGWASTLAGIAFGNSGTHLPHAMSYGVTHLMRDITTEGYPVDSPFVPHGISVIVSAPAIFRYTAAGAPARHLEAAHHLLADHQGATEDEAGEVIANHLVRLMRSTDMPNGLSGVGFGEDRVNALADSSFRQQRAIANAPRESNLVDLQNMYRDAISYW